MSHWLVVSCLSNSTSGDDSNPADISIFQSGWTINQINLFRTNPKLSDLFFNLLNWGQFHLPSKCGIETTISHIYLSFNVWWNITYLKQLNKIGHITNGSQADPHRSAEARKNTITSNSMEIENLARLSCMADSGTGAKKPWDLSIMEIIWTYSGNINKWENRNKHM